MEKAVNITEDLQEEAQFVVDDVSKIIKDAIEIVIGSNSYQQNKVNNWTTAVVEACTAELTKLQKPYKYIVTCTIMQKNGAGLHTASSCYWDNNTDGSCTIETKLSKRDKMSNNVDIGPKKTMFILVVVIGCFSVLWPKVFYPMLVGNANQQMKPSPIDKTTGCCDVISDSDVNTIKILVELCNNIVQKPAIGAPVPLTKELITQCRTEVLATCGIDIEIALQQQVRLGKSVKQVLNEVRSLNGSLCLKYNFGVAPWSLGVPHLGIVNLAKSPSIRQERPAHMRPELLHPALRERGRAIPATNNNLPRRIVEGRPGPIPGMRPPMGGAGHVVPPSQKGTSTMSVVMPIYTIGIVIFFTYTLMKLMFKKPVDSTTNGLYPPVQPDKTFRKQVFEAERTQYVSRHTKEEFATKLGWKERDTRDIELDQLRRRLRETELAMERIVAQMGSVPLKSERSKGETTVNGNIANGTVVNGNAVKPQDEHDPTSVKVLGMEMTASCEGGQKWSRPNSPLITPTPIPVEPVPPPQSIYLEGALPAQSQLLVSESATETEAADLNNSADPAVVLSGKMTLSVISLDSLTGHVENGKENNKVDNEEEVDEIEEEEIIIMDDDDQIEESKYTTASNATAAENDISDEEEITDGEQDDDMEED
ncbi:RIC3 acetylcholine receptor chaperone [Carabus blaptoides fortunei]